MYLAGLGAIDAIKCTSTSASGYCYGTGGAAVHATLVELQTRLNGYAASQGFAKLETKGQIGPLTLAAARKVALIMQGTMVPTNYLQIIAGTSTKELLARNADVWVAALKVLSGGASAPNPNSGGGPAQYVQTSIEPAGAKPSTPTGKTPAQVAAEIAAGGGATNNPWDASASDKLKKPSGTKIAIILGVFAVGVGAYMWQRKTRAPY